MDCKDCRKCIWAVWYDNEIIACCNPRDCPSEEDFERAEREGSLAI